MECYCDLRNVEDLPANGKSQNERRFGESFKRTNCTIWCTCGIPSNIRKMSSKNSSIWRDSINRDFFSDTHWSLENLERRYSDCWSWGIREFGRIRNIPRRLNAKEVLITQRNGEFVFPVADGSAKLSGRDYEIPGTHSETGANRKERGFQPDSQGAAEESQPAEQKRWTRSTKIFLVYSRRFHLPSSHWTESSTFMCQKKKHFLFHLKYIDVTRSTYTDLDIAQEKRIDDYWERRWKQKFVRFVDRFHENLLDWKRHVQKDMCGPGGDWQKFKRRHVQIIYGLEVWTRIGQAAQRKIKKQEVCTRKAKTRECQKFEENLFYWSKWMKEYKDTIKNAKRKLETHMAPAMPCKEQLP